MATSGITVSDASIETFTNFKLRKGTKSKFIIFKIGVPEGGAAEHVIVDYAAAEEETYDNMLERLPNDDCRYVALDYAFESDGRKQDKLILICWSPDSAPIKKKMLYTSTKSEVTRSFNGINKSIQANDRDEVSEESIRQSIGL